MKSTVLHVDGLGKRYVEYRSEFSRIASWFGAKVQPIKEYWAVRDISFSQNSGEALALIGQNGAGKSTLLKLITGTVRPTTGQINLAGRVSAILELGLGFDADMSGRHNVYQAGGLMGFSNEQLKGLIPEIEAFAEIGDFFDQPLRSYSSGMQARLAFALATAMRPEILIVDEVLSVGDSYFQHKSFSRIREFKRLGTSIVLVTHSMQDVRQLCDRVILLDKGRVLKDGQPDEVVDYYNAMIAEKENAKLTIEQRRNTSGWVQSRSGTFEVVARDAGLVDATNGTQVAVARVGQPLVFSVTTEVKANIEQLVFGAMIRDRTGHIVWGSNTWHTQQILQDVTAGQTIDFSLRFPCNLGPGSYSISYALTASDTHLSQNFEWADNEIVFDVVNVDLPTFIGSSSLNASFEVVPQKSGKPS